MTDTERNARLIADQLRADLAVRTADTALGEDRAPKLEVTADARPQNADQTTTSVVNVNVDVLADRYRLAELIPGVTAESIKQWAKRGRIHRYRRLNGRTLYRLGDVLAARDHRHARAWSLPPRKEVTH